VFRSDLKNVFWLNIGVGFSFQVLDNLASACGLQLAPASTLNQNPIVETASGAVNAQPPGKRIAARPRQGNCDVPFRPASRNIDNRTFAASGRPRLTPCRDRRFKPGMTKPLILIKRF